MPRWSFCVCSLGLADIQPWYLNTPAHLGDWATARNAVHITVSVFHCRSRCSIHCHCLCLDRDGLLPVCPFWWTIYPWQVGISRNETVAQRWNSTWLRLYHFKTAWFGKARSKSVCFKHRDWQRVSLPPIMMPVIGVTDRMLIYSGSRLRLAVTVRMI